MPALALAPIDIIHEPQPGLQLRPRPTVEAYLTRVAIALTEGWSQNLDDISETGRGSRFRIPGLEEEVTALLKTFKAEESLEGIMKTAVFVNHQWVMKLGWSAVQEMEIYDSACGDYLEQFVPSVWLDADQEMGLLQLKVEIPEQDYYGKFSHDLEAEYHELVAESGVGDLHRGNVGLWQDRLVIIDFEGG